MVNKATNDKINLDLLTRLSDSLGSLTRGRLWLQVLIAIVLGVSVGLLLGPSVGWVPHKQAIEIGNWLALPGQLFLTLIQMIVIPLIIASIIHGLAAAGGIAQLRVLGSSTFVYFVLTTIVAIAIGIGITELIQPGQYIDQQLVRSVIGQSVTATAPAATVVPLADLPNKLVGLLPRNPLVSMVQGQMLQIVIFTLMFGIALVMLSREQAKPILELMASLQEVCMTIVKWAMWLAPLAVFGLLAQLTAKIGLEALYGMGIYVATVITGLLILMGMYMVLLVVFAQEHPWRFLRRVREVLLLAFSTSSSAAVMPLSIRTAESELKVPPSIAEFVIPIGATINMNGTALYQGAATIFLAQVFGIDISLSGMLVIILLAVGASIGSPGTPGVGIIILALILDSVGIPMAGIALIVGVDRILDMCRTAINVCGDLVAAKLLSRWLPPFTTAPPAESMHAGT